ncbi:MAG: exo-alpha-sialidase, partial [Candidatus Latescibacteria bacterium]|nr:exo-alpha-sialidase [Candidatus Latescibacterota bacterium]
MTCKSIKIFTCLTCCVLSFLWVSSCDTKHRDTSQNDTQPSETHQLPEDTRNIEAGLVIPDEGYCDQPYVVINEDGSWTCTMTTGSGHEGSGGQHIISICSTDQGKTWSAPVDIEPSDGPEASWVMPLKIPGVRIYAFYTYNADNMRDVIAGTDYARKRVDTLGAYMFKYSDDNGASWSKNRYTIPVRLMDIDRKNPYHGDVLFFWGVGNPIIHNGSMYLGFNKIGSFGEGFIESSQACFLKSDNILTESDPEKINWITLPEGESGLVAPKGPIAEESNLVGLNDGSLYCTYRTVDGSPCHAYSRDGGRTWTATSYMTYTPGGKRVKHPRAANFVWKASNGKYLYWYHNHGGKSYDSRNPVWLCGGVERYGYIYWSQPEILIYDDNIGNRMSYPDFIEQDGRYFMTETQKTVARVHEIDGALLEGLWNQQENTSLTRDGLILELTGPECRNGVKVEMPRLPYISRGAQRGGLSFDFRIKFS